MVVQISRALFQRAFADRDAYIRYGLKELIEGSCEGFLWSRIDSRDRDHVVDTFLGQGRFSEYETSIGYRNVAYFHKRHEALQ